MTDEKKQSTQQETSTEPDKTTPPPEITFVLDHKVPELDKKQQQIKESGGKKKGG